jgi:hypothetical protein
LQDFRFEEALNFNLICFPLRIYNMKGIYDDLNDFMEYAFLELI